ncbi:hypothetical protein ACFV00_35425, partial [Streptomyces californicus]
MRIGLLTEGARPYATGEPWLWRGRLVRGLTQRAFAFTVPSHPAHRESRGRAPLPRRVNRMRTAPQRDRRGGGRHEVSGAAAALPGPLAKRFFGAPLTAVDQPGAAARVRSAVAQGLAACRGIPREPMAHAPAHRKAYATDAYGTPPPSAGPAATDSGGAPGSAPVAVPGSTPAPAPAAPALVAVPGSEATSAPMAFSVSELAPALTALGSALVVVPGSTPAPAAPGSALVVAPGSTLAPALAAPAPVPATGPVGAGVVPAGTPLLPGTVPQSASAPAQGSMPVPAAPGSTPASAAPGSALVPAPAPVALPGSEPAPVPRR